MKTFYVAIRYTDDEEHSYQRCIEICNYLLDKDFNFFSPILQNHPLDVAKRRDPEIYYEWDRKWIASFDPDILLLCDDWWLSKGCQMEKDLFEKKGKEIITFQEIIDKNLKGSDFEGEKLIGNPKCPKCGWDRWTYSKLYPRHIQCCMCETDYQEGKDWNYVYNTPIIEGGISFYKVKFFQEGE